MSAILSIILIIVAAVAAFFFGRWHGLSTGTKELNKELESKDKELNDLKHGVNEHFDETARLFSNLTEEYKTLYQHLSLGANKLSDKDFKLKLSAPVGADALPSEARAADVVDSEEHLTKDTKTHSASTPEEPNSDTVNPAQSNSQETILDDDSEHISEKRVKDVEHEETSVADNRTSPISDNNPGIDEEVSPPKDWADDDMDDNYQPNDSTKKASKFTDLASEKHKKPKAPGYDKSEQPVDDKQDTDSTTTDSTTTDSTTKDADKDESR